MFQRLRMLDDVEDLQEEGKQADVAEARNGALLHNQASIEAFARLQSVHAVALQWPDELWVRRGTNRRQGRQLGRFCDWREFVLLALLLELLMLLEQSLALLLSLEEHVQGVHGQVDVARFASRGIDAATDDVEHEERQARGLVRRPDVEVARGR